MASLVGERLFFFWFLLASLRLCAFALNLSRSTAWFRFTVLVSNSLGSVTSQTGHGCGLSQPALVNVTDPITPEIMSQCGIS